MSRVSEVVGLGKTVLEIMEKLPVYAPNRCTKDMPFGFWLLASLSPAHTLLSYPRLLASHLGDMWPE